MSGLFFSNKTPLEVGEILNGVEVQAVTPAAFS